MKKALVVGINYAGTGYDLRGCINDAYNIKQMLQSYQFDDIELLLEAQATTNGIKSALTRLTANAMPGDVLVFHYSGHGSQVPGNTENDGYDEIICPFDLDWTKNFINDDYLKLVFNSVPNGVNVTVILDSCHSGTSLDQRGLMTSRYISNSGTRSVHPELRARYLPPPASVQAQIDASKLSLSESIRRDVDVSAVLIAASKDSQLSADAKIDDMYQGAGTYSLLRAVKQNPQINYRDAVASMNQYMVEHGYDQSPQLNGPVALYKQKVFQPWDFMMEPSVVVPEAPTVSIVPNPFNDKSTENDKDYSMYIIGAFILLILLVVLFQMS